MRGLHQEFIILAKRTAFADMKITISGVTGAPTTDRCFPQFHDIIVAARKPRRYPASLQTASPGGARRTGEFVCDPTTLWRQQSRSRGCRLDRIEPAPAAEQGDNGPRLIQPV